MDVEPPSHRTVRVYFLLCISQNAAKQAAAAATQTIAAAQNAAASNKNTAAHQQLVQSCKVSANADCRAYLHFGLLRFYPSFREIFISICQLAESAV